MLRTTTTVLATLTGTAATLTGVWLSSSAVAPASAVAGVLLAALGVWAVRRTLPALAEIVVGQLDAATMAPFWDGPAPYSADWQDQARRIA
ncbi:MAG: hypothetical protein ACLGIR_05355 [Actinomycetes bacterium]